MGGSGSGRPKNPPNARKMLKEIIPVGDIFEEDELVIYTSLVDIYMRDFDEDDLSSGDIDDIMTIATNKVLEIRLLKSSKGDASLHMDISTSIEKLRKQTEKIKENLSVRRKDRVDPAKLKGLSIVDLAVSFDQEKRIRMENKARRLKAEQVKAADELAEFPGNKYDVDSIEKEELI